MMQAEKQLLAEFPAQTVRAVVPLLLFYANEASWVGWRCKISPKPKNERVKR
jgi:hypothetical protein